MTRSCPLIIHRQSSLQQFCFPSSVFFFFFLSIHFFFLPLPCCHRLIPFICALSRLGWEGVNWRAERVQRLNDTPSLTRHSLLCVMALSHCPLGPDCILFPDTISFLWFISGKSKHKNSPLHSQVNTTRRSYSCCRRQVLGSNERRLDSHELHKVLYFHDNEY